MNLLAEIVLATSIFYLGFGTLIATLIARTSRERVSRSPADLGLAFEDISFTSRVDRIMLQGWYLPGGGSGTVIVVHGGKSNREDTGIRLLELCRDLTSRGFNVITFDRRNCGTSQPSKIRGKSYLERDLGGAIDYVRNRSRAGEPLFVLGVSMGAVTAILSESSENGINGIICDSCFASTKEMAQRVVSGVSPVLRAFIPGASLMGSLIFNYKDIDLRDRICAVKCPILFIHPENDSSIPITDVYELYRSSVNPLNEIWIAPNSGHSEAYRTNPGRYIERVTRFLLVKCAPDQNNAKEITTIPEFKRITGLPGDLQPRLVVTQNK